MEKEIPVLLVGKVGKFIKELLESAFPVIRIFGEISNYSRHSASGHLYFSLKDTEGLIKAVCFKENVNSLKKEPQNGDRVIITGKLSAYIKSSNYQVIVTDIEEAGMGDLHKLLLELKEKLFAEGLFDEVYKKRIPLFPKSIGLITASGGAVLHDIMRTIKERMPVKVMLFPSLMQGRGTVKSVISGIKYFNKEKNVDVIIIARGGGSFEDLFEFNNEELLRTAFKSKIPIISAIGHETDFTLLDFVASARAATPTASAHLAVPSKMDLLAFIEGKKTEAVSQAKYLLLKKENPIKNFTSVVPMLKGFFEEKSYMLSNTLGQCARASLHALYSLEKHLEINFADIIAYDYQAILSKGFAIVANKEGKQIMSPSQLINGEEIDITLRDGKIEASIIKNTLF